MNISYTLSENAMCETLEPHGIFCGCTLSFLSSLILGYSYTNIVISFDIERWTEWVSAVCPQLFISVLTSCKPLRSSSYFVVPMTRPMIVKYGQSLYILYDVWISRILTQFLTLFYIFFPEMRPFYTSSKSWYYTHFSLIILWR